MPTSESRIIIFFKSQKFTFKVASLYTGIGRQTMELIKYLSKDSATIAEIRRINNTQEIDKVTSLYTGIGRQTMELLKYLSKDSATIPEIRRSNNTHEIDKFALP